MEEIELQAELQATPASFSILYAWNFVKDHSNSTEKDGKMRPVMD